MLDESKKADESTNLDNPLTLGHSIELDASHSTADLYRSTDSYFGANMANIGLTGTSPQRALIVGIV